MFPYDSIRDFTAALEKDNKLLKIPEMDQDQYESGFFRTFDMHPVGTHIAPKFRVIHNC